MRSLTPEAPVREKGRFTVLKAREVTGRRGHWDWRGIARERENRKFLQAGGGKTDIKKGLHLCPQRSHLGAG